MSRRLWHRIVVTALLIIGVVLFGVLYSSRREEGDNTGVTLDISIPKLITEGGPWGATVTITNRLLPTQEFMVYIGGDVGAYVLDFVPRDARIDIATGSSGTLVFWFSIPERQTHLSGDISVHARDAQGTLVANKQAGFVVVAVPTRQGGVIEGLEPPGSSHADAREASGSHIAVNRSCAGMPSTSQDRPNQTILTPQ